MDGIALGAFILTAVSWLIREILRLRSARIQASNDASTILNERKTIIQEMTEDTDDANQKEELRFQLDEVNAMLLGLHSERLRRTLKSANLPTGEILIADGLNQLQPQQIAQLRGEITEIQALPQSDSAQDLMALASANYYAGQYEEALIVYNRSLELRPDDPDTLTNRGVTYYKLERYNEALADFNRSLELRPDDSDTLYNRGATYYKLERYDEALTDFDRSLELEPDDPGTLTNRAVAYIKLGRYDEALVGLNRSLELRPDDPDTLYNIACLFAFQKKPDDALVFLEKAINQKTAYREDAKTDKDFDNIKEDPRFKKLIGLD